MKLYRFLPAAAVAALLLTVSAGIAVATGLQPLAQDCSDSPLPPHDGFQEAPACVSTAHGEVAVAERNPSLLITDAPDEVDAGEGFSLVVSTRNLVRDRFLAAGKGGYYLETGLLNEDGITRGHFHVSCRVLASDEVAPDPAPVPEFFQAVEDSKGGVEPDSVEIEVPGETDDGDPRFREGDLVQCAAWAGDGSHRMPLMERANQTPAFDAVRFSVR